jgi:hypothetical protein
MATYYTSIDHPRPSKICPNRDFWYEIYIPSGNPGFLIKEDELFKG